MTKVWRWIEALFEEHKLVRRFLVFWAVWLITYVILIAVEKITVIDVPAASMISAIIGILATVTAFYIKSREIDDRDTDS